MFLQCIMHIYYSPHTWITWNICVCLYILIQELIQECVLKTDTKFPIKNAVKSPSSRTPYFTLALAGVQGICS